MRESILFQNSVLRIVRKIWMPFQHEGLYACRDFYQRPLFAEKEAILFTQSTKHPIPIIYRNTYEKPIQHLNAELFIPYFLSKDVDTVDLYPEDYQIHDELVSLHFSWNVPFTPETSPIPCFEK